MSEGANPQLTQLREIVENLRRSHGDNVAVVLIGSAARGVWTEASDIDLLLMGNVRPEIGKRISGYHIQTAGEAKFLRNLGAGEDFEAWCVRFGTVIYDGGMWAKIKQSPAAATWPKWQVKVIHGARRLFMARSLLETGDSDAAIEETIYTLGHVARAILLRAGVFPLSRPELAEQVRKTGYPHLADMHERLRQTGDIPMGVLGLAQRYSKKLLCHLDAQTYRSCAEDYRRKKRAKEGQRDSH